MVIPLTAAIQSLTTSTDSNARQYENRFAKRTGDNYLVERRYDDRVRCGAGRGGGALDKTKRLQINIVLTQREANDHL